MPQMQEGYTPPTLPEIGATSGGGGAGQYGGQGEYAEQFEEDDEDEESGGSTPPSEESSSGGNNNDPFRDCQAAGSSGTSNSGTNQNTRQIITNNGGR